MVRSPTVAPSAKSPRTQRSTRHRLAAGTGLGALCLVAVLLMRGETPAEEGTGGSGSAPPLVFQSFDGRGTYVELGNPPALGFSGPMTLEAWIRPRTLEGVRDILSHDDPSTPGVELSLRLSDGRYEVGFGGVPETMASAPARATDMGQWVHLAGVYDGARWTLYRDGEPAASSHEPFQAVPIQGPWAIGARGGGTEGQFLGDIRDVRIWSVPRTPQELRGGMSQLPAGVARGLVGDWPLNEGEGAVAQDATSNGNDGFIRQGVWGSR